jgi:replicative DNA helicase
MIDTAKPPRPDATTDSTSPPNTPRLFRLDSLLDDFADDAERRHDANESGKPLGALTGHIGLDRALGGALVPGIHVLHGTPGSGKTAFALQAAGQCQCPSLYLSCEMTPLELLRRITARITRTYLNRFKTGEFSRETALGLARRACQETRHLAILDGTTCSVPVRCLGQFIEATRQLDPNTEHLLLVVDSVHAWVRGWQAEATEYDGLNAGIDALRTVASRYQCAVLAIGERNRASMKTGGQNAAAGTRSFEYSAETVLDLKAEDQKTPDETPIVLTIEKNRHGAPGKKIELTFEGALQEFRER